MNKTLKKSLRKLSKKQIEFICKECNVDKDTLFAMNEDKLDNVYDILCGIEISEFDAEHDTVTEKGETAADIVTIMGNKIAKAEVLFDEEDYELLELTPFGRLRCLYRRLRELTTQRKTDCAGQHSATQ